MVLLFLPIAYVAAVTLPHPFGLGLQHGNDFQGHRIWWTDLATWYLKQGQVPFWSPSLDFGTLYPGQRGHAFFYPLGWWLHLLHAPMIPAWQTWGHYIQICLHMAIALLGVFRLLRDRAGVSEPAAVLGASLLLINQRFHDSVRYPNAIETMAWIPWILFFALRIAENTGADGPARQKRWRDTLFLTLLTALGWLAGYGHLMYIAAILIAALLLISSRSLRSLLMAVGSATAGSLLAAASLFPTAWMALLSPSRSGDNFSFITLYPMTGSYLEMFAYPLREDVHASAFFPPIYLGLIFLGCWVAWKQKENRKVSLGLLIGAVAIMDLSRGANGILCRVAYDYLPMYNAFRVQGRNNWIAIAALCWFAGLGADRILSGDRKTQRTGRIFLLLPLLFIVFLHFLNSASAPSPMSPQVLGEMSPRLVTYAFWMFSGGTTLVFLAVFLFRKKCLIPISLLLALWCFLFFFGRFSTWYRPPPSTSVHPSFPNGLLAPFRVGAGLTSQSLVESSELIPYYTAITSLEPTIPTQFPATRFAFFPDNPETTARASLKLESFGANHLNAQITTDQPGRLIYFNTMFPGWHGTPEPKAADAPLERFMSFAITPGTTKLQLRFLPISMFAAAAVSILGVFSITSLLIFQTGRNILASCILAAGFALATFAIGGAITRRPMAPAMLFGKDLQSLDPQGRVPVISQWPQANSPEGISQGSDVIGESH